jgi:hypothetical protein
MYSLTVETLLPNTYLCCLQCGLTPLDRPLISTLWTLETLCTNNGQLNFFKGRYHEIEMRYMRYGLIEHEQEENI